MSLSNVDIVLFSNSQVSYGSTPMKPYSRPEAQDDFEQDATVVSTSLNIVKNCIGASILVIPWAIGSSGYTVSVVLMLAALVESIATFFLLGLTAELLQVFSYRDLATELYGEGMGKLIDFIVFGLLTILCSVLLLFVGDFMVLVLQYFTNNDFATNRTFILAIIILTLLPLKYARTLNALTIPSALGMISIMFLLGILVFQFSIDSRLSPTVNGVEPISLRWFQTLATFAGAFGAHVNAPRYYGELKNRTARNFGVTTMVSFIVVLMINCVCGYLGYFMYGAGVEQDITMNLPVKSLVVVIARLGVAVAVMCGYPLAYFALRETTAILFLPGGDTAQSRWWYAVPIVHSLLFWLVASSVENVGDFVVLMEALFGVPIGYIFPPLFYLKALQREKQISAYGGQRLGTRLACYLLIAFGVVLCVGGTVNSLAKIGSQSR